MHFSVFGVCAVLVLLTVNAVLDIFSDLVLYIRELIVLFDKFYHLCNTRVSVKWIVVVAAYNLVLEILWYLRWYTLFLSNLYYGIVELLRRS